MPEPLHTHTPLYYFCFLFFLFFFYGKHHHPPLCTHAHIGLFKGKNSSQEKQHSIEIWAPELP